MKRFFSRNIDKKGRLIRGGWAFLLAFAAGLPQHSCHVAKLRLRDVKRIARKIYAKPIASAAAEQTLPPFGMPDPSADFRRPDTPGK